MSKTVLVEKWLETVDKECLTAAWNLLTPDFQKIITACFTEEESNHVWSESRASVDAAFAILTSFSSFFARSDEKMPGYQKIC
jgi:hypothetical protein